MIKSWFILGTSSNEARLINPFTPKSTKVRQRNEVSMHPKKECFSPTNWTAITFAQTNYPNNSDPSVKTSLKMERWKRCMSRLYRVWGGRGRRVFYHHPPIAYKRGWTSGHRGRKCHSGTYGTLVDGSSDTIGVTSVYLPTNTYFPMWAYIHSTILFL